MNWRLITYLAIIVLSSSIVTVNYEEISQRIGALIGFIITVWLLYMAGVFTLL